MKTTKTTKTTIYRIETRPAYSTDARDWTTDGLGADESNRFASEAEAETALRGLRRVFADDRAQYRIVEATTETAWDYAGYWAVVLGDCRSAADVCRDCGLTEDGPAGSDLDVDEWLCEAEAESWTQGGHGLDPLPEEWADHHERALVELLWAVEEWQAETQSWSLVSVEDTEADARARADAEADADCRGRDAYRVIEVAS